MFSQEIYESWRVGQNEKFAFLLEHFPRFFSGTILDVGCGKNFLRDYIKRRGIDCKIIGTDISGGDVVANADNLPFGDENFDKIICIDAIHLINNDFHRVLRENGTAIVSIFFNDSNYEEKRSMLLQKVEGLRIVDELISAGREKELFVVARKTF